MTAPSDSVPKSLSNLFKKRQRPTLGVLTDWTLFQDSIDPFLLPVYRGMQAAATEHQCNLLIGCSIFTFQGNSQTLVGPLSDSTSLFVPIGHWNTDGLIVITPISLPSFRRYVETLQDQKFPLVAIGQMDNLPSVQVDNISGIHQAMTHLAAHGHRRIVFVAGKQNTTGDSLIRLNAYRAAVKSLDLDADERLVVYGDDWASPSRQVILDLLKDNVEFTAVLAGNDASAYGVLQALRESDRQVPNDVAVMGFDDIPDSATYTPPLSTVRFSQFEIGYQAVELLLKRLAGQSPDKVLIPVHLVLRQSCGCQAQDILADTQNLQRPSELATCQSRLTLDVEKLLTTHSRYLSAHTIANLSSEMAENFFFSVANHLPDVFEQAVRHGLEQVEAAQDTPDLLHLVLLALADSVSRLPGAADVSNEMTYMMLERAHVMVSQHAQRQHTIYAALQSHNFTQMGFLNAHLLTALSEPQVLLKQLAVQLPFVGFSSALVAFFQEGDDDPVARCQAYQLSQGSVTEWQQPFPTREFPPPGMYPEDRLFQLALFSLRQERAYGDLSEFPAPYGFAAFDLTQLEQCGPIVLELAAIFKSIRLYQAALEGHRLAEEANQLKSRFLASVSHELRTPLNLLIGLSEMLVAAQKRPDALPIPEEYRSDIEHIHGNAQHLGWLIRDVLDLASSQTGQLRLTCAALDVAELLKTTFSDGQQLASAKGLTWETHLPANLPRVWGDPARLRQVVLNLISNAVKFTEQGKITLTVELSADQPGTPLPGCMISVTDTGIGIAQEEQAIIFDEFRQAERSRQLGYGGVGLGLAISKRIVERHGGEMGVISTGQMNGGSTIYFNLPMLYESPAAVAGALPAGIFPVCLVVAHSEDGTPLLEALRKVDREATVCVADADANWQEHLLAAHPRAVIVAAPIAQRHWEWIAGLRSQQVAVLWYSPDSIPQQEYTFTGGELHLSTPLLSVEDSLTEKAFRIVIADDEPGILDMNSRLVQKQFPASKVLRARDGREALELIQQNLPDLAVLDLHMPQLDGFGVLAAMRQGETTRHIPVIVLTAQVLTESDMARLNQGVATVLEKGIFNHDEILAHIQFVLANSRRVGGESQWLARKVMAYIHSHYADPITRNDLARHAGVTDRYLTRCFQQELGMPPMEYLTRYRNKQAKVLLATTRKSITEIADVVGYATISSFTQAFKREEKQTPSAYRSSLPSQNP